MFRLEGNLSKFSDADRQGINEEGDLFAEGRAYVPNARTRRIYSSA